MSHSHRATLSPPHSSTCPTSSRNIHRCFAKALHKVRLVRGKFNAQKGSTVFETTMPDHSFERGNLAAIHMTLTGLDTPTLEAITDSVIDIAEQTVSPQTAPFYSVTVNNNSHRKYALIEFLFKTKEGGDPEALRKESQYLCDRLMSGEIHPPSKPAHRPPIAQRGPGKAPYYPAPIPL